MATNPPNPNDPNYQAYLTAKSIIDQRNRQFNPGQQRTSSTSRQPAPTAKQDSFVPSDKGFDKHPAELKDLITNIRNNNRQGLPKGFRSLLASEGGSVQFSQAPSFNFINRNGVVYYQSKDSDPRLWKSTAVSGDRNFKLVGQDVSPKSYMEEVKQK